MTELSSGEIKLMFKRIDEKLDDHTEVHEEIMQAIKDLKILIEAGKFWLGIAKGAIAVFIVFVLPVMFWTVTQVVSMDRKIAEALDGYEIDISE